jgi:FkbM family methyltransferase
MNGLLQNGLLKFYRLVFARGLMQFKWGRKLFFALYDIYKLKIEAGPIAQLQAFVPAGAVVIDVGANVGFFALRFAHWAGHSGKVIAVEPETSNFEELTRRIAKSGLADVLTPRQALVDATPGTRHLIVNVNHPGDHRLGDQGLPVAATTIDDLRDELGCPVQFIKIDVQGAEGRVLAGAKHTLAMDRPALFIEIDPAALRQFSTTAAEIFASLEALNYQPHILHENGAPKAITRVECEAVLANSSYIDVLFLSIGTP